MKPIYDLQRLTEEQRLQLIADAAGKGITGVVVDDPKVAQYIRRVLELNPEARHLDTMPFTKGTTLLRFAPKAAH